MRESQAEVLKEGSWKRAPGPGSGGRLSVTQPSSSDHPPQASSPHCSHHVPPIPHPSELWAPDFGWKTRERVSIIPGQQLPCPAWVDPELAQGGALSSLSSPMSSVLHLGLVKSGSRERPSSI